MIQTYSSKPNNVTSLLKILPYAGGLLWVENDSAAAWPQLVATLKYIHEEWTRISQVGGASISEDNIRDAMLAPLRDLGLVGDLQPVLHLAQVLPFLSHLTNLHLSLSQSHDLNLAEVLTACPDPTHLAITGRFASIHISQSPESHSGSFKIPQLPSSLRLKSLYLGNVQILQPYLERVKTLAAPCLRELRLVHLRLEMVLVFVDTIRTIAFDAYLFGLDIRLQFFHFSLDGVDTTKEQFEEFQSQFGQHSITAGWGLNVDTANMLLPHVVQVPNVVTTLELYRGKGASEVEVESLSNFLWDSPSLLHCGPSGLRAPTLAAEIQGRIIFGYLSRVCPELADVQIEVGNMDFRLEGGLCLLSRWTRLESLFLLVSADSSVCQDSDLNWMKVRATFWQRTMRMRQVGKWESSLRIEAKEMELQKNRMPEDVLQEVVSLATARNHRVTAKKSISVSKLRLLGRLADVKEVLDGVDATDEQYHCEPCLEEIRIGRKRRTPRDIQEIIERVRPKSTLQW
ncbi:hypothetical protein BG003_009924 [Podila horticola]|nr:hypothetical protein BG003_009924 [Podila horticola]